MPAILWPVLGHLALLNFLFVMVSCQRFVAVRDGAAEQNQFARAGQEPERSRRWARNLDNQFQVPMLFYAIVVLLLARDGADGWQVALAWVFLFGRVVHTGVQVSGDDVRLRGMVFTVNYLAVMAMWGLLFLRELVR